MKLYQIKQMANDFEVPERIAVKMRIRHLYEIMGQIVDYVDGVTDDIPEIDWSDACDEMKSYVAFLKHPEPRKGEITEEMIVRARNYPVEALIDFSKGSALAWCHEDHTPSLRLSTKLNRATCFPCGKSFNPIDVLMCRDKKNFVQAVEYLCK